MGISDDNLETFARRLEPRDLASYGARPQPGREAESAYYLVCGAPLSVDERQGSCVIEIGTPDGNRFAATAKFLPPVLLGRPCWLVLVSHPPRPRETRWHCHILKSFRDRAGEVALAG